MEKVILNSFETQKNGETVSVVVSESEVGIEVEINGVKMNVNINGQPFYSHYDKPGYEFIPPNFRDFTEKHIDDDIKVIEGGKEVKFYILVKGQEFAVTIVNDPKNRRIEMRDWLNSYEKVNDTILSVASEELNEDKLNKEGKDRFDKLIHQIKDIGYNLLFSHGGNEYDDIWYLEFSPEKFNEEKVYECLKLWNEYNKYLMKQLDKYDAR